MMASIAAGPERAVVRPSCEADGKAEAADPGEEMDLGVSPKIGSLNCSDVTVVNVPWRQRSVGDPALQNGDGERIDLVVVGAQRHGVIAHVLKG